MTEGGQTFFYNDKNGEFQWSDPVAADDKSKNILQNNTAIVNTNPSVTSSNTTATTTTSTTTKVNPELGDWRPYKDPETGSVFWYNIVTKVSQWECPINNPNSNINSSSNNKDDDSDAIVVNNDDDLGI
jgi:hypothetical protein